MPPTRDEESSAPSALRKGAACLQCRKRKMRCDAGQPHCANCVKGKKDCQYAAGRAKTKTQLLREKIQDLESKIRALEQQTSASGSTPRRGGSSESSGSSPNSGGEEDPNDLIRSPVSDFRLNFGSGTSSHRSDSVAGGDSSEVPIFPTGTDFFDSDFLSNSNTDLWSPTRNFSEALLSPPSITGVLNTTVPDKWWERPEPPKEIRDYLVGVVLQRADAFHFHVKPSKFLVSLELPPPDCPHPCLMNAIYLVACHFTNSPEWTFHEPMFLARARESLLDSLAHSDRLDDFLMASNMVSYYLYRTGRFLEGHHQTAGASRFAVSCGLHQIMSPVVEDNQPESSRNVRASAPWSVSDMSVRRPGSMLHPPRNGLELGHRIIVFWNTYLLDKLGSAVTSLPGSLPDDADPLTEILTAWPRTLDEYERGDVQADECATIRNLYDPLYSQTIRRRPETLQGLQAQITALHERASKLSPTYLTDTTPAGRQQFWAKFSIVQDAITRFSTQLPNLYNTGLMGEIPPTTAPAPVNQVTFVIHTFACLAVIQLHNSLATEIPESYDRCLAAAKEILVLAQRLTPDDYAKQTMEVILSYAWTICAQVLIRHHRNLVKLGRDVTEVNHELDLIIGAMENLRLTYPVVEFQLRKVNDWRNNS